MMISMSKKVYRSENYNFVFDRETGLFARWGRTEEDDPMMSPKPEIADVEISTICHGVQGVGACKFCYKGNTPKGQNMSLDTFKKLLDKIDGDCLSQIAFGVGDVEANPDIWKIFQCSRNRGVIPNVTVNGEGITDEIADKLVSVCGAVAVSVYDKNKTYDAVKKLTDRGLKQTNIHFMISNQTYSQAFELIYDKSDDKRLENLNAIVFLSLKPKGRAKYGYSSLSQLEFDVLVDTALRHKINFGFDSCGCGKFLESVKHHENFKKFEMMAEPCESGLFSSYFNVEGKFFPCSFMEGVGDWREGIEVIDSKEDFWSNSRLEKWRGNLLKNKRRCPIYEV